MSRTITSAQIDALLAASTYEDAKVGRKTTVVVCILPNGFEVIESSGCVDPANYNHALGVETCKRRIIDRVWQLEGYRLQAEIAAGRDAPVQVAVSPKPADAIMPTPGRIVWYRGKDGQVRAAIVTKVHGVWSVNLHVFAREPNDGEFGYMSSVTHADPTVEPACFPSWHWMPYQLGQAAKTAAAEAKIAK